MQREDFDGVNTTAQVFAKIAQSPLIYPPGKRPAYSNLGAALLGHLLAEYVYPGNRTLPDLVAEYITGPLGMADTG